MRTILDEQADALTEEFAPFTVWVDFRPMGDGQPHFHARLPDWTPDRNLHAHDATGMRDALIRWQRQRDSVQVAEEVASVAGCDPPGEGHAPESPPEALQGTEPGLVVRH